MNDENIKICEDPAYKESNPIKANFCRKCGKAFKHNATNKFTLDTFKDISLIPVSVAKVRFISRFSIFVYILFILLFLFLFGPFSYIVENLLWQITYVEIDLDMIGVLRYICLCAIFICFIHLTVRIIKKIRFNNNAHYIENKCISGNIVRIAHYHRMGLFDKRKKKVILTSYYTNIHKFDAQHLLIYNGRKKGLYSLQYRKLIIPVGYESIVHGSQSSVFGAVYSGAVKYYDVKGNILL